MSIKDSSERPKEAEELIEFIEGAITSRRLPSSIIMGALAEVIGGVILTTALLQGREQDDAHAVCCSVHDDLHGYVEANWGSYEFIYSRENKGKLQ